MNISITAAASSDGGVSVPASGAKGSIRGLRLIHLWLIVPLVFAWFAASLAYIEPYDFWWNLKSGQIMMQTGQFLGTDVLVWTPVRLPYSNPQWGSQLLFYWIYNLSPYLLLTVRAIIITASVGLLIVCCFSRTRSMRVATIAAIIAYFTAWTNYGMRPQLLAFIPFLAYLFLLERKDIRPRLLPLLVPIMLFWVNVHGSFFLGLALIGIYALGSVLEKLGSEAGRRWLTSKAALWQAGWFAAAGLITLANPYLFGIYSYFFAATNDPIARSLNKEWQAPTLYEGTGILFFLNVLIFLGSLYLSKRRLRPTEVLVILAFGYLALTSLRNVMWWGWVTAPILASNFSAWFARGKTTEQHAVEETVQSETEALPATRTELPALNWVMAILLVGGALFFTPLWREANPLVPQSAKASVSDATPIKLAEFLKSTNPPAPLFNYMEWGGYLEWEMYPRYQMFIDGRFEAREVQVWKDYLSVSNARADWQKTLDHYKIRTLILNKTFHDDLIPMVDETPTWRKVYEDTMGVVYTR